MEGNHRFNDDQSTDGVTPPIHEYEHVGNDCSISGSALYRGAAIPALVGYYVFADYCSGQVRALQIAERAETNRSCSEWRRPSPPSAKARTANCSSSSGNGSIYAVPG